MVKPLSCIGRWLMVDDDDDDDETSYSSGRQED
jgi:hypothetical protein